MNKKFLENLKKSNMKLMPIPESLAREAEEIAGTLKTNPVDAIGAALNLLKYSLGRDITMANSKESVELHIPVFKDFKRIVKLDGEK